MWFGPLVCFFAALHRRGPSEHGGQGPEGTTYEVLNFARTPVGTHPTRILAKSRAPQVGALDSSVASAAQTVLPHPRLSSQNATLTDG